MITVTVTANGRSIRVVAPPEARRYIRKIPTARWSDTGKFWSIRPSRVAWQHLCDLPGVHFDGIEVDAVKNSGPGPLMPWPSWYVPKTVPYTHQMAGSAQIFGRRESAIHAEPGTGKTKMAIDAISAKYGAGLVSRLLVMCPKSVRAVWVNEFTTHCPLPHHVQILKTPSKLPSFNAGLFQVLVISSESMSSSGAFDTAAAFVRGGKCALVIDEAHMVKTHNTQRTKNAKTLADACVSTTVMTGTPVGNSLVDLYAQYNILDSNIIGYPDYWSFCDRYCIFGGYENRQIVAYENEEELMGAIAPYTFRATKADCLDLPPKVYERRTVQMSAEQKALYKELKKKMRLEGLETKTILDLNTRLHQLAGGFMPKVTPGGATTYSLLSKSKVDELLDVIDDCGGQSVVIWCAYRHEISHVVGELSAKYGRQSVVEIHGGVDEQERSKSVDAIQSGLARFIVGITSTGGAGITITAASLMVYYSNNFSYIYREQSLNRCHRIGQTRTVTIIDLVAEGTIDEDVMNALDAKMDLAQWVSNHGKTSH